MVMVIPGITKVRNKYLRDSDIVVVIMNSIKLCTWKLINMEFNNGINTTFTNAWADVHEHDVHMILYH